jgi:hypothetical protein
MMSSETDPEKRKREIFEGMSSRRQQRVLKKGYEKWDPFLAPKEPPFYRREERERGLDAAEMMRRFLQDKGMEEAGRTSLSLEYVEGVREVCVGLIRDRSERTEGIFDFCVWLFKNSGPTSRDGGG